MSPISAVPESSSYLAHPPSPPGRLGSSRSHQGLDGLGAIWKPEEGTKLEESSGLSGVLGQGRPGRPPRSSPDLLGPSLSRSLAAEPGVWPGGRSALGASCTHTHTHSAFQLCSLSASGQTRIVWLGDGENK